MLFRSNGANLNGVSSGTADIVICSSNDNTWNSYVNSNKLISGCDYNCIVGNDCGTIFSNCNGKVCFVKSGYYMINTHMIFTNYTELRGSGMNTIINLTNDYGGVSTLQYAFLFNNSGYFGHFYVTTNVSDWILGNDRYIEVVKILNSPYPSVIENNRFGDGVIGLQVKNTYDGQGASGTLGYNLSQDSFVTFQNNVCKDRKSVV